MEYPSLKTINESLLARSKEHLSSKNSIDTINSQDNSIQADYFITKVDRKNQFLKKAKKFTAQVLNDACYFAKNLNKSGLQTFVNSIFQRNDKRELELTKRGWQFLGIAFDIALIALIITHGAQPTQRLIAPLISSMQPLHPITQNKGTHEIFGFAPFWTFDKLDNVDFTILTTMAYFGFDIYADGSIDKLSPGYKTFHSREATETFKKAHDNGTRVVLTITQMDNEIIRQLMDDPIAQESAIDQVVAEVKNRGIDGINVDFEYSGNPGQEYRDKFTQFVADLTTKMHQEVPGSKVSVSVYASAIKEPKIYDISGLGKQDIKIFMMAYDFGYRGSDQVIPTAPLYGHKEGKYWYDVSSAVEDFLAYMPADKLILGTPWYGYNYAIYGEPRVKADTARWGGAKAQTYTIATDDVNPDMDGILDYKEGWDEEGKVAWKAYYVASADTWRMIFIDDTKSNEYKYDFAKNKGLAGVGMWALGFDEGKTELWSLLAEKFGAKVADASILNKTIYETEEEMR